jgi:polysaccharide export outer membrane protein
MVIRSITPMKARGISARRHAAARAVAALACGALALAPGRAAAQRTTTGNIPVAPVIASPLPDPTVTVPTAMDPDLAEPAVPDSYRIGNGDLLSVFVYQMPDLTRQVRVSSNGKIALPLLRRPLRVTGLTAPALGAAVRADLLRNGLATDPIVQVIVRQVESRPIVVAGAVRFPGVLQATRPMTLLEVLSRAGGLGADAGTRVLLTEKTPDGEITHAFSVSQIEEAVDPGSDPVLNGGETVRVLPAEMAYAVGAFKKPGGFPVRGEQPLTVLKVVALAQGIKSPAAKGDAEILHQQADGSVQTVRINLDRILKNKAPDLPMRAGDILFLPESTRGKWFDASGNVLVQASAIAIGYTLVR